MNVVDKKQTNEQITNRESDLTSETLPSGIQTSGEKVENCFTVSYTYTIRQQPTHLLTSLSNYSRFNMTYVLSLFTLEPTKEVTCKKVRTCPDNSDNEKKLSRVNINDN